MSFFSFSFCTFVLAHVSVSCCLVFCLTKESTRSLFKGKTRSARSRSQTAEARILRGSGPCSASPWQRLSPCKPPQAYIPLLLENLKSFCGTSYLFICSLLRSLALALSLPWHPQGLCSFPFSFSGGGASLLGLRAPDFWSFNLT